MDYVLIFLGWSLYFFTHSFLANNRVKEWFKDKIPVIQPFYRMLYNIIAIAGLVILFLHYRSMEHEYIFPKNAYLLTAGYLLITSGSLLGFLAFRYYDTAEFFGLTYAGKTSEQKSLNISGINKYIRHPLYTATYIGMAGIWILEPTKQMLLIVSVSYFYLWVGAKLEEKKLIAEFGKDYLLYKERTPMFIPHL